MLQANDEFVMGSYRPKPHDPKDGPNHMYQNCGGAIVPQIVTQALKGNGNQFKIDVEAEGGDVKMDSKIGDIAGNSASGVQAHADAAITQDAFTQNITQGANIQFNSITMNVAGHDLADSHDLG
jgi:hypothetical protein